MVFFWKPLDSVFPRALVDYDIGRYATGSAAPAGKLDLVDYDNATWSVTNGTGVTAGKVTTHAKEHATTFNINLPAVADLKTVAQQLDDINPDVV